MLLDEGFFRQSDRSYHAYQDLFKKTVLPIKDECSLVTAQKLIVVHFFFKIWATLPGFYIQIYIIIVVELVLRSTGSTNGNIPVVSS